MNTKCPHCGQHYNVDASAVGQAAQCSADHTEFMASASANPADPTLRPVPPPEIPNYLWQSIVVTILCCWAFGIPSIVYATQVNSKVASGDIAGAWKAAKSAKTWAWISFTIGLVCTCITVMVMMAGLLLPVIIIHGGLANIQPLRAVGNNGRNIVMAIIAADAEREATSMKSVLPTASTELYEGLPKDYTVGNSETYFADLISSGAVEGISWNTFAGAGMPAATDEAEFLSGGYNAWSYIAGLDEDAPDDTPFLFSSNIEITTEDLRRFSNGEGLDIAAKLKPFGDTRVVFITRDGAMQVVKTKFLRDPQIFLGSAEFSDGKNANATVVAPKKQ